MNLAFLEIILLRLTLITPVIFIITIVIYYWKSRKTSNNYLENKNFNLKYFIQKQVDFNGKIIGYECLLRQQHTDGSWSLPEQLDSLPLQRVVFLLEDTFKFTIEIK